MTAWLANLSPVVLYLLIFLVVGGQFLCLPLPATITLTTAGLLAAKGVADPVLVCVCAVAGALAGSSLGYRLGRRGGRPLVDRLAARFPGAVTPRRLALAEDRIRRWGNWLIVVSCFSALLRMVSAPLAGAVGLPLRWFTLAMATSAVLWSVSMTVAIQLLGQLAEAWVDALSWVGLASIAVLLLVSGFSWLRARRARPSLS